MDDDILKQQLEYYRARAPEYDQMAGESQPASGPPLAEDEAEREMDMMKNWLRGQGPFGHTLELACGTGIWTAILAQISEEVTAIDGAPEMLEINRAKVQRQNVRYQAADLFQWQ